MDTDEAIHLLQTRIDEIPSVKEAGRFSGLHLRWLQNLLFELSRLLGEKSPFVVQLRRLTWSIPPGIPVSYVPWEPPQQLDGLQGEYFRKDLERAEGILRSALDQLQQVGLNQLRQESGYIVAPDAKKVFIAHGRDEDVLRRVEDFVRALGCEPVIVERLASGGASVDDLVEQRMEECQAAVILATGDDEIDGRRQPRPNVIHEIGLAQRVLQNRVIYLREEGCEFPSNVAPKVWENFTKGDLASAFEKIAKELRGFGLVG
jgi:hypothetical protein